MANPLAELQQLRSENLRLLEEREFVTRDVTTSATEEEVRYLRRSLRAEVLRRQKAEQDLQRLHRRVGRALQMVRLVNEATDEVARRAVLGWVRTMLADR